MRLIKMCLPLLLLTGCSLVKDVEVETIEGFEYKGIDKNKVLIDVNARVKNPNAYKAGIVDSDLDLWVNKKYIGKITKITCPSIKAKTDDVYTIGFEVEIKNLLAGIFSIIEVFSNDQIDLKVQGTVKAKSLLFRKNIKVDIQRKISTISNKP